MKKAATLFFLLLWTVALVTPLAVKFILHPMGLVFYFTFEMTGERREPSPRPSMSRSSPKYVSPKAFGRSCESWYNDNFPWRVEILRFHRDFSYHRLKTPVGREVPGHGNWIFLRGSDWAEIDDFLGAFELTDEELEDWVTLFEGRREWANAIGSKFVTLVAPVKAQVHSEKMHSALRMHRGNNIGAQVRKALVNSPARDDVLFANDDFKSALASGREVFYDSDHHPNAYGIWLIYDSLNRRLAELFPDRIVNTVPWYDNPPDEVRKGQTAGCWPDREGSLSSAINPIRMEVSSPDETVGEFSDNHNQRQYPYNSIEMKRKEGGLSILMAHDSYMRFSLSSWNRTMEDVRLPFATGVGLVRAIFFRRYTQGLLEDAITKSIPDVFIEQIPECRLDGTAHRYSGANLRAAAAFGRAKVPPPDYLPQAGERIAVRAVFEDVSADEGVNPDAILKIGGQEVERRSIMQGVRRAVFFGPIECDSDKGTNTMPEVELAGAWASATNMTWRLCR